MAKKLQGSKTIENLMKAFAGESQARNRYTIFAGVANKEGHAQIERVFQETAENERVHAKEFYKLIAASVPDTATEIIKVDATYPVVLGNTLTNLRASASGEHEEFAIVYKEFAEVAETEGYTDVAFKFRAIGNVEAEHEKRFAKLADNLEKGTLYKKEGATEWRCIKCGHIHKADAAPKVCPVCAHPQGYFEIR